MITLKSSGNFNKSLAFFNRLKGIDKTSILNEYGKKGVEALRAATPVDTGKTADSWDYEVTITGAGAKITWSNSNRNDGVNVAIILQYGHGTRGGGYVKGIDYINPALKPIFDEMAATIWKEATK